MFDWFRQPVGYYFWFDLIIQLLNVAIIIFLIVYAIKRYKLHFPPWKPLALLSLSYWATGMFFAGIHGMIWYFNHEAYDGLRHPSNWEFVYFSFVTITTVGYGDIHPVSYLARWFSILEACVGLFFIAVLVAILIGHKENV